MLQISIPLDKDQFIEMECDFCKNRFMLHQEADNTPDFIEVPSSAIQSENIAPNHKTAAMSRGRNHLILEITDQASASFLHTLLGVMMDAQ